MKIFFKLAQNNFEYPQHIDASLIVEEGFLMNILNTNWTRNKEYEWKNYQWDLKQIILNDFSYALKSEYMYLTYFISWLHSDTLCMQEFHKTRYFIVLHNFVKDLLILPQNDKKQ
jgi:hypothetical protein